MSGTKKFIEVSKITETMFINKHETFGISAMLLALLSIVGIAFLMMPVSASTDITLMAHNPPVFSMTLIPSELDMGNLQIGDNTLTTNTPVCTVTTNSNFQISAYDTMPIIISYGTEIVNGPGYLKEFTSGHSPTGAKLAEKLKIRIGSTDSWSEVTGSPTVLHTGIPGTFIGATEYKQVLGLTDHASSTNYYKIYLTFDGAPTA